MSHELVTAITKEGSTRTMSSMESTHCFTEYFAYVYHPDVLPILYFPRHPHQMQLTSIPANILVSILSKLNPNKSPRCDSLHPHLKLESSLSYEMPARVGSRRAR